MGGPMRNDSPEHIQDKAHRRAWELSSRETQREMLKRYRRGENPGADIPLNVKHRLGRTRFYRKICLILLMICVVLVAA